MYKPKKKKNAGLSHAKKSRGHERVSKGRVPFEVEKSPSPNTRWVRTEDQHLVKREEREDGI